MGSSFPRFRLPVLALVFMALGLGCAGSLPVQELPTSANPSEEINRLATQVEQARSEKVDILSPTWFARASESLSDARDLRKEGGSVEEILRSVAKGQAALKQARSFADVAATTLPDTIAARDAARAAGAPSLGEEYDKAEEKFLALTRGIENDELSRAQRERDGLTQRFRSLELKAIKDTTLASVRATIEEAVREGAERVAPKALSLARVKLADTDKFIAEQRYATEQMNERAEEALFYANRAVALTRFANESSRRTPEQRALDEEAFLVELAAALGQVDLRDRSIEDQRRAVENTVTELRKDRDFLVTRSEVLREENDGISRELAALRGTANSLEEDRRFSQLYGEVSAYFDPTDAEVYKQGDKLLIRLKGIRFPVGDYVIQPEDYAILTKVQMAIRAFGDPNVLVEGHTDSTGGLNINQHLSEKRADAVRAYLIANNVLPANRITAVGKADAEPLAPNTSPEGRSMNRRIDVIIEPQRALPSVAAPPAGG
jgi:outer membrane protein OmpA-like peptidoglycan-associated protein